MKVLTARISRISVTPVFSFTSARKASSASAVGALDRKPDIVFVIAPVIMRNTFIGVHDLNKDVDFIFRHARSTQGTYTPQLFPVKHCANAADDAFILHLLNTDQRFFFTDATALGNSLERLFRERKCFLQNVDGL